jgi:BRCT domain type II-containing protein
MNNMNVQKEVATKTTQFTVPIKKKSSNTINNQSKNSTTRTTTTTSEIDDRRFLVVVVVVDRCFIILYCYSLFLKVIR